MTRLIKSVTVPVGESGKWKVSRFEVTKGQADLASMRAVFNGGRGAISAGEYTQLTRNGLIVMSDTPDEKMDHFEPVRKAHGHVLINGLGLGMVLGAILEKSEVDRVTVVEIDQDLIHLVGPHYACDKLEIVNASAFDYAPPRWIIYGVVWHDIWDDICTDNIKEMTKLKRKYWRRAKWQGCWSEFQSRQHLKRYA